MTSGSDLGGAPVQVCLSEDAAIAAVARGADVVLVMDDRVAASSGAIFPVEGGEPYGRESGSGRGLRGRLALFLGEVANPAHLVEARAMAEELFGRTLPPGESDRR